MNLVCITGYLLKDAAEAYTTTGALKLICEVMIDNGEGQHVPYRCNFNSAALILKARPYLTAGRSFIFHAALDGHIYEERGVQKGWVRYLRVHEAEFPARSNPKSEEKEQAA